MGPYNILTNLVLAGGDDKLELGADVLVLSLLLCVHQIVPIGNIDLPICSATSLMTGVVNTKGKTKLECLLLLALRACQKRMELLTAKLNNN